MSLASGGSPTFCDCAAAGVSVTVSTAAIHPETAAFLIAPLLLAAVLGGGLRREDSMSTREEWEIRQRLNHPRARCRALPASAGRKSRTAPTPSVRCGNSASTAAPRT